MYSNFLLISAVLLAHAACTTARIVPEPLLLLPPTLRSTPPSIDSALPTRVHVSGVFGSIGGQGDINNTSGWEPPSPYTIRLLTPDGTKNASFWHDIPWRPYASSVGDIHSYNTYLKNDDIIDGIAGAGTMKT
jgi:hypothetical protein